MDAVARAALTADLRAGLDSGAFEPVFQPVARLRDGALAGFEALARWRRGSDGLEPTSVFLDAALEDGLLGEISKAILFGATRRFAQWRRDVPQAEHLFLSVNVAGHDLEHGRVLGDVVQALKQADLPAKVLRLEVTETQILRDPVAAGKTLKSLRDLGVRILLDDFGAGYSSLHWLMRLPADAIKFDSLLVQGVARDGAEHKILRAMMALARDLKLETVAEGVETEAQREALMAMQCDYAQGYLYAQGLPDEEAVALLRAILRQESDPT